MEINTQQLDALLNLREQQAREPRKGEPRTQGFENILNRQLDANDAALSLTQGVENIQALQLQRLQPVGVATETGMSAEEMALQAAFNEASGTLDLWDSYTRALGGSTTDHALRDAYSMLESIDERVAQLRSNPAVGANPGLDGVLNELEVMAATEKFKFNRGDYLG